MDSNSVRRPKAATTRRRFAAQIREAPPRILPMLIAAAVLLVFRMAAADLSRFTVLNDEPLLYVVAFDDALLSNARVERESDDWWWKISQETVDHVGQDNDLVVSARHLRNPHKGESQAGPIEVVLLNIQPGASKEDVLERVAHPGGGHFDWVGVRYKKTAQGSSSVVVALAHADEKFKFPEQGPPSWHMRTIIGIVIAGLAFYILITLLRGREVE